MAILKDERIPVLTVREASGVSGPRAIFIVWNPFTGFSKGQKVLHTDPMDETTTFDPPFPDIWKFQFHIQLAEHNLVEF